MKGRDLGIETRFGISEKQNKKYEENKSSKIGFVVSIPNLFKRESLKINSFSCFFTTLKYFGGIKPCLLPLDSKSPSEFR